MPWLKQGKLGKTWAIPWKKEDVDPRVIKRDTRDSDHTITAKARRNLLILASQYIISITLCNAHVNFQRLCYEEAGNPIISSQLSWVILLSLERPGKLRFTLRKLDFAP